ncbi:MAG: SPOR domain-containing protein, partial [Rickettsiales bacterium]|nr:SPOR domain-containing protein [Rickettsiales bacterium]
ASGQLLALNNAHSSAYAERGRKKPSENPAEAKLAPAAGPAKQYWVQVVSAGSQMQALKEWEQLKASNTEIVGNLRSSVSSADKRNYVVRVGPIAENDQAIRICSQLQKRNVECRVLMYSRGGV